MNDGAAVSFVSEEFLAIRRALQNYIEPVESPEHACITIPGVDFLNLMKFRSGVVVQKVIETVQRDLNGARTNLLLFNNIGMIEKMQYKVIWASAEHTSKQFRTHFDIAIPPLRPYNLLSADSIRSRYTVKKPENRWTVYSRFAEKKLVEDMERILNLFRPNADRLIFA
uniref:LUD_dom domain-containing protein n=1 Tax=Bursaphelenchus xylophilus TaxID=6326 RepID=A0A1I7SJL0_BURXY